MIPFIMLAANLLQKKQQENAADNQRIADSMQVNTQQPQVNLNAQSLLGNQTQQPNLYETEEEKRKRLGLF
jgi:hypothetical protein